MPGLISAEQEQAIARRAEPLLVAAGAGSGKTAVLVERFVRAVREDGLPPSAILAITFTESAAAEVKERVRGRLLELGERTAAGAMGAAFVSTFHAFCARLLRSHPLGAGLEPGFEILDEGLAARAAEHAFADALRTLVARRGDEAVDLLAAYGSERLRAMVLRVHSELRARGERRPRLPEAIAGGRADGEAMRACALLDELLCRFGERYEERKRARGALDFDDLELCALELLREREEVCALWSRRFELLMVDEFQDTNPRQLAILRALERGNLFTVGDELQSIYGFRDADVGLFRARRAELAGDARSLSLTRNYRSRPGLLEVVNAIFEARLQGIYAPLVAARQGGANLEAGVAATDPEVELLFVDKDRCGTGETQGAGSAGGPSGRPALWRVAEARMLAGRVAELVQRGEAQPARIAVLLRALGDAEVYERALRDRGLQTLAPVGGFWSCAQVCDLLAYLRALANPLDEVALHATLACPLVGLSSDGLVHLARFAAEAGKPIWSAMREHPAELERLLAAADATLLGAFASWLADERAGVRGRSIARLIERARDASGYGAELLARADGERPMANVRKLISIARRFEASEGRDLRGFLDYAAHQQQSAAAGEADAPTTALEAQAVRLMSIHAAKGLEFDVVCLADLGRAPNLEVGDLLIDGARVGLRLARLDGGEPVRALDFDSLCEERRRAQAEEEERILYVAMTRARERLLLSGAVSFARWPDARQGVAPLAWLGPALSGRIPEIARAHAAGAEDDVLDLPIGADGAARLRVRLGPHSAAPAAEQPRHPPAGSAPQPPAPASPPELSLAQPELPIAAMELPIAGLEPARETEDPVHGVSVLSYSALHQLERCGYRFYLERVLGLCEEAPARGTAKRQGLEARARGTLVHRLLESVDFAAPAAPAPRRVAAIARQLGVAASRAECERVSALTRGMLCDAAPACARLRARASAAPQTRREHPFAFALQAGAPLLAGVLDLLAREQDGCALVIDYKTDQLAEGEDLCERVQREYALQRQIYALALLRGGAGEVEVVHWFWQRPQEPVGVRYGAGERAALERALIGRLRAARARGFAVSSRPHRGLCEGCPGRGGLCSWGEAETGREKPCSEGAEGL
jgi:ATP-dependent helicase/nuclease subunit A